MKSLFQSKLLLIIAGITCITAFIWAVNVEDSALPSNLFFIGWFIGVVGILSNMFYMDSKAPMAKPLKLFAIGFSIAILAVIYGLPTDNPSDRLFDIGFAVCAAGIAWGIFSFGSNNKNL
ncbi:MAG: hypothetical protein RPT25_09140 [Cycloclasticus sp.]